MVVFGVFHRLIQGTGALKSLIQTAAVHVFHLYPRVPGVVVGLKTLDFIRMPDAGHQFDLRCKRVTFRLVLRFDIL